MRFMVLVAVLAFMAITFYPHRNGVHAAADDDDDDTAVPSSSLPKADSTLAPEKGTASDSIAKEAESIKYEGLSPSESKQLREKAEKHEFQAEVSRMMKLIINSLYKNKEIFLRELISNASDALDKIRFLSITDKSLLGDVPDLKIKIQADKENKVLHIIDTGIGMTKEELVKNLGTIAKSGTSEFFTKVQSSGSEADTSNLIGQFGVGFYSAFLVADTVVVTSKANGDKQHIWTSDAASFSIVEDPREDEQLGRGTKISLYLKDEAQEYLEPETLKNLITKYSEFINFDIYLFTSKQVESEEESTDATETEKKSDDDEVAVEEDKPAEKKKVMKTVWDWEVINANKPIWTRNAKDITDDEYNNFYKAFSRDTKDPLSKIHFTAEGEVTFKSILYIPSEAPTGFFQEYGKKGSNIKMYVRRVFITDEFEDILPKYLSFFRGVVDSDDLPLNVSRETLQQHKLLKVIKKKLVRKALELLKKMPADQYKKFWKEYGTAIKLGLIEDYANRTRLAKLLRFTSSHGSEPVSLEDYVSRMKKNQSNIFFVSGIGMEEVQNSPFVERLLKRGFEVLYLTEPVDEYTLQNLPEFEGKKFQNAAKEGLTFGDESSDEKTYFEQQSTKFEPLTKWLSENLKDEIEKAVVSARLAESPCALVANAYGWSANMERIMEAQAYSKSDDSNTQFYKNQKKTLEINPRHPLVKNLLTRVADLEGKDSTDDSFKTTLDLAQVMVDTARLRSGFSLKDSAKFAARIEKMLKLGMNIDLSEQLEPEPEFKQDTSSDAEVDINAETSDDAKTESKSEDVDVKDEL